MADVILRCEGEGGFAHGEFARAFGRGWGQVGFAHGEEADGAYGDLCGGLKIQEGCAEHTHIGVVGDGEGDTELVVVYEVVVPFFDTQG